jgi:IS30 family transposase
MHYAHLTQKERYQIEQLKQAGFGTTLIARRLGRDRSTITREIKRGSGHTGCYAATQAQLSAQRRRRRCALNAKRIPAWVWHWVDRHLLQDWSPEQIRGRTHLIGRYSPSIPSIYAHVARDRDAGGSLYRHLRHTHRRIRGCSDGRSSLARLRSKPSIRNRPAEVLTRKRLGHWEGDTMRGPSTSPHQLVTMVERRSRYLQLRRPRHTGTKTAQSVAHSVIRALRPLPALSITFDNGSEFAQYRSIAKSLQCKVYFAEPRSPNQRATCENTIGLVRQYLPKGTDLSRVSCARLDRISNRINHRPRKTMGYRTPYEVLFNNVRGALRI